MDHDCQWTGPELRSELESNSLKPTNLCSSSDRINQNRQLSNLSFLGTYKLSNRLGIERVAAETINGVRGIGHNPSIDYKDAALLSVSGPNLTTRFIL